MKILKRTFLALWVLMILLAITPTPVQAQGPDGDGKLVFGGTYTLYSGESLNGDLVIMGGTATIEEKGIVDGSIVLAGGSIQVDGEVNGDIVAVGGALSLGDSAVIHGDINTIGATIKRAANTVVEGDIHIQTPGELSLSLPNLPRPGNTVAPLIDFGFKTVTTLFTIILQSLAVAALAMLAVLFMENYLKKVRDSALSQPLMAGGLGILTLIVAPGLLILLAITILLLPVSLLGILLLGAALLFGWIAIGMETGERIARALRIDWGPAVETGVGTLLISLVGAAMSEIPCVGWILPAVVAVVGLGGVLLAGFGGRLAFQPAAASPAPAGDVRPSEAVPAPDIVGSGAETGDGSVSSLENPIEDDQPD